MFSQRVLHRRAALCSAVQQLEDAATVQQQLQGVEAVGAGCREGARESACTCMGTAAGGGVCAAGLPSVP